MVNIVGAKMRIRTKPTEYDAIEFNGVTDDVLNFIKGSYAKIHISNDYFILSDLIGDSRLSIGDILLKNNHPDITTIQVLRRGDSFDKSFEIIELDV